MARIARALTLGHRPNLGEETRMVEFEEGEEVTLLQQWSDRWLVKNREGLLFNVPLDAVEE